MAKFIVTVLYSQRKEITVYARSHDEAEEKAAEIVSAWERVEDAESVSSVED